MNLELSIAPAVEPITQAEAKLHLKLDHTDEDNEVDIAIAGARAYMDGRDGVLNRAIITQTWTAKLDGFPSGDRIDLPLSPLQSIGSITYRDADSVTQTLATSVYTTASPFGQGQVVRKSGQSWPSVDNDPESVTITFVCGYGLAADVPPALKAALLLDIGHKFENRESVIVGTIAAEIALAYNALIGPFMVQRP